MTISYTRDAYRRILNVLVGDRMWYTALKYEQLEIVYFQQNDATLASNQASINATTMSWSL